MHNFRTRQVVAAIAALVGAYLLYGGANPESDFGAAMLGFWAGVALFGAVAWLLIRYYTPGSDVPSEDEVNIREWTLMRFLRYGREAAPLYLGLRLFLAWEWIESGWGKVQNPAWTQTGEALRTYWERAVAVPAPPARPSIVYPAYRSFIQFMLDNEWYVWFASLIAYGELLIGLGFLFGWRVAGWWGVDQLLLPRLGTPWRPGPAQVSQPAPAEVPRAASG